MTFRLLLQGAARQALIWTAACTTPITALVVGSEARAPKPPAQRDVLFISTSDCHYDAFENEGRNGRNRDTIAEINAIDQRRWPEKLGGGTIGKPRGVLVLGDCIDDGDRLLEGKPQSAKQFEFFAKDFGLNGTDGLLRYPVFEGWGNHDGPPEGAEKHGFSFQAQLKKRNRQRLASGLIDHLSENGLHYAWNWDDVRFVQLNLYPADRQRDGVRYSPVWHDPRQSFAFLKADLAKHVGRSGRPVVLMSHCGFDTDWWTPDDWNELYQAMKPYRIVLYLYGHSGTGVRRWAPKGETRPWLCINDGQTEKGFFVVHITGRQGRQPTSAAALGPKPAPVGRRYCCQENNESGVRGTGERIRVAYRMKSDVKVVKNADRTETHTWGGQWEWRYLVDEALDPPPSPDDHRPRAETALRRPARAGSTENRRLPTVSRLAQGAVKT